MTRPGVVHASRAHQQQAEREHGDQVAPSSLDPLEIDVQGPAVVTGVLAVIHRVGREQLVGLPAQAAALLHHLGHLELRQELAEARAQVASERLSQVAVSQRSAVGAIRELHAAYPSIAEIDKQSRFRRIGVEVHEVEPVRTLAVVVEVRAPAEPVRPWNDVAPVRIEVEGSALPGASGRGPCTHGSSGGHPAWRSDRCRR